MNTLLIDIGNSRIKWALLRSGLLGKQQALPLTGSGAAPFARILARGSTSAIAAIVAVSVAGTSRERALEVAAKRAGLPRPLFIRSSRAQAGVRNGYRDPWRLGADRWVAAIGAWRDAGCRRPVCVISVGTALTVDLVDAKGRHRGGLIAPGPALMLQSLLHGTQGIAPRAAGSRRPRRGTGFATDTRAAIESGATLACVALMESAARAARAELGPGMRVYLTGGAAPPLRATLRLRHVHEPALVLRGLAEIVAPARMPAATVAP